jgi:hypothetical protein
MNNTDIESFPKYTFHMIYNGALSIILGVVINKTSDFFGEKLGLNFTQLIIIQIFLNICVLYLLKLKQKHIYHPEGDTIYGIMFAALFIGSQRNLLAMIEKVYGFEKPYLI